ncbi:MAG TPA: universal stress protein [Longimicrobium sp.]|nr:universal stress protein [Longimicrobium sp.]
MSGIHTILAGIEHPSADDPVLAAAAALALRSGAGLHLLHAYEIPPIHDLSHHAPFARHDAEVRGRLEAAAREVPGAEGAACHAAHGAPAGALLQAAEEVAADLVVIGAGGRHGLVGGTARRVLRDAAVPVLVLRRPVGSRPGRVLLATDLSVPSAVAHERGLEAAASLLGEPPALRSLLVVGRGTIPAPLPEEALARAARAELRLFLRERTPHPSPVEPVVRTGSPPEEIVAEAEAWGADLLIVGTHGRVLLGSVAESVVREAPCNVLAVPASLGVRAVAGAAHGAAAPWAATLLPIGS